MPVWTEQARDTFNRAAPLLSSTMSDGVNSWPAAGVGQAGTDWNLSANRAYAYADYRGLRMNLTPGSGTMLLEGKYLSNDSRGGVAFLAANGEGYVMKVTGTDLLRLTRIDEAASVWSGTTIGTGSVAVPSYAAHLKLWIENMGPAQVFYMEHGSETVGPISDATYQALVPACGCHTSFQARIDEIIYSEEVAAGGLVEQVPTKLARRLLRHGSAVL